MNQTIQKNRNTLVRSKAEGASTKTLLATQENPAASKEMKLLAFSPSVAQRKHLVGYMFFLVAFLSLTIYGLTTDDVIQREACKALVIILLLIQLKNITQPVKQN